MQDAAAPSSRKIAWIPTVLFALFFGFLALSVHWSDSELWAIGLARRFFAFENAAIDYKFFFNLVLNAVYLLPLDNLATVQATRLLFAAFGLGTAALVYRFSFLLTREKKQALWTLFLFAASTLFLSQGFKIRSDLMACFFQMAGLVHFLNFQRQERAGTGRDWNEWGGLLLNAALFLSTPKAVFHFLVNLTFMLAALRGPEKSDRIRSYFLKTFLLPFLGFLVLVAWKRNEFGSALEFFLKSYSESPQHPAFWSAASMRFVTDAILKNGPLVFLFVAGIPALLKWRSRWKAPLLASAAVACLLIFFHSDRLPFFIFSLTPLLVVVIGEASFGFWRGLRARSSKLATAGAGLAVLAILGNAAVFTFHMLEEAGNRDQILAQAKIENYVRSHPGYEYSDGTVVLPRDNTLYVFPAPLHEGNRNDMTELLNRTSLSLFFFSNRMFLYLDPIYHALEDHYFIQVGPGVFARSYAVRSTHVMHENERGTICQALGLPQKLFVYEGSGFLRMKPTGLEVRCDGDPEKDWPKIHSTEPFLAFSVFGPITFENDRSFAQIFDHRPLY